MAIWKVSYVVKGGKHPGGIINLDHEPKPGEIFEVGDDFFAVVEVFELIPSKRDFHYIHATCVLQDDV